MHFYEDPGVICSISSYVGRQCPATPDGSVPICVDSGFGEYANLEGLAPWYLASGGHAARPIDANPPYLPHFDTFFWSLLSVFVVWAGVGWTSLQYYVVDSQGWAYEALFMLMHIAGAWFLMNLVVAVLGAAFERETLKQKALKDEQARQRAERAAQDPNYVPELTWTEWLKKKIPRMHVKRERGALEKDPYGRDSPAPALERRESESSQDLKQKRRALRGLIDSIQFRTTVVIIILAYCCSMAVDGPFMKAEYGNEQIAYLLGRLNIFFGGAFLIEGIMKLAALGFAEYIASPLNVFDAITNGMFVAEMTMGFFGIKSRALVALKTFRMIRIFKLAGSIPQFHSLIGKMMASVNAVYSMLLVLVILIFFVATGTMHVYAAMYDDVYGGACLTPGYTTPQTAAMNASMLSDVLHSDACALKPRHHFDNIAISYITIFQVMTTDNWVNVMWDTFLMEGTLSFFLFPTVIVIGNYITMNIFLAILLSTFSAASKAEAVAADLAAEHEAKEVAEAAKAAAAVTANAELMMRGQKFDSKKQKTKGGRSPSPGGSPEGQGAGASDSEGSPDGSRMGRRVSLRVDRSSSRSPSPDSRKRGAISFGGDMSGLDERSSPTMKFPEGSYESKLNISAQASAMAAAAAAALGPDATLRAAKVFRKYDWDDSGTIEQEELCAALKELGLESSADHVAEVMGRYDIDQSSSLDLAEFLSLVRDTPPAPPTAFGRLIYGMMPIGLKESNFVKTWVANAAKRAAQKDQEEASKRAARERLGRKQRRSLMRQRSTRYGSLNAWEVAFFRGAFERADIDGDGFLVLDDVYALLMQLDEEPASNDTWDVLDANAGRDDLISKEEFLVFVSIKRNDDAMIAARGGQQTKSAAVDAARAARSQQRRERIKKRQQSNQAKHSKLSLFISVMMRRLDTLRKSGRRVYLERLPNLGEFAREGLGEERSRFLQRVIYSTTFWYIDCILIVTSAIVVTSEIDAMVRRLRLAGGATSMSSPQMTPGYIIAGFDSAFMIVTASEIVIKCLTEGFIKALSSPWNLLDLICLSASSVRLFFATPSWKRTVLSFSSLRVFMLIHRFKELKLLFESILRAMPNVLVTMASLMIIWLMFAILGTSLFGGGSHQCARLNDTAGYHGCNDPENPISCRYAKYPLPPPVDVIPGVTNSSACGCYWDDGENYCSIVTNSIGEELAWVPAYPNFDNVGKSFLALLQISTLDGWSNIMYFGMDITEVDTQPARESQYFLPIAFYVTFVIFGVLFATNVFVGVVIDEFNRIRRMYDGSATLTEEQIKWVNTQKLILRLAPEKQVTFEPGADKPWRRWCFRLVHDEDALGRPTNAPDNARYHGKAFERIIKFAIVLNGAY